MSLLLLMDDGPTPTALVRAMFAQGEQGIWLDPSDFSSMFQDAAGTTPVTALGQPVGLALDKRLGMVRGPELVSNGTFTGGGTGWTNPDTAPSTTSFVNNTASLYSSPGSALARLRQTLTVAAGTYEVSVRVVSITGGLIATPAALALGNASSGDTTYANISLTTLGTHTRRITVTGPTLGLAFTAGSVAGGTIVVDDVSVKLIAGNHAYQTTSASRPTVQARVNLLTYSEQLDNAAWAKGGTILPTVTPNAFVAPDGTTTMDAVVQQGGASSNVSQGAITEASTYYVDFWLLAGTATTASIGFRNTTDAAWMDVTASILQGPGSISAHVPGALRIVSGLSTSVHTKVRLTTASPVAAGKLVNMHIYPETSSASTVGKSIGVWGAELRKLSDASYPYQKVNSATDYVDVGAPRYLSFDGTDDGMATPPINFTGTDKMTVWAGVRKLSDAASATIVELSSDASTLAGSFLLRGPTGAASNYALYAKGTAGALAGPTPSPFAAPTTNVLVLNVDTSLAVANKIYGRVNKTTYTNSTDMGTGNFGNYPLYIGRRNNAERPFNGRIYQLIVRGAASNAGQIAATEAYVNSKTRAF